MVGLPEQWPVIATIVVALFSTVLGSIYKFWQSFLSHQKEQRKDSKAERLDQREFYRGLLDKQDKNMDRMGHSVRQNTDSLIAVEQAVVSLAEAQREQGKQFSLMVESHNVLVDEVRSFRNGRWISRVAKAVFG